MTQIGHSRQQARSTVAGHTIDLSWAAVTHTGYRRSVNEDSLVARSPVFAVADGMGGHTAGDVASGVVVRRLAELASRSALDGDHLRAAFAAAVEDITEEVEPNDLGTGTTVTGIALTDDGGTPAWLVFNIGDSRVYRLDDGGLAQLTVDHSVVQELLDSGAISREEADVHPHANVITRALGFNESPDPDFTTVPLTAGSRFLIASDGLMKELTDHGIRHFLDPASSAYDAAQFLLDAALGNGGRDNITVVVVDVVAVTPSAYAAT